jgi:DNA-binding response OmpR family regulator
MGISTGMETRTMAAGPPVGNRILIVDDNRDAADSLAMLLGLDGHDVHVSYTGHAALDAVRELRPSTVVLDLGLPDLNGFEVARRLRSDESVGRVRLIALTGWGQADDRRRTHEAGFDHHLTKPVDPDQLHRLLQGTDPAD